MAEIYYMSDILVNASLKMGNIARTITESLAMNTPTIVTTFKGLDNIINESNGVIIPTKNPAKLSDAICHLHDMKLKNVRESLNPDYTLDAMANSTIDIYKKVLRRN
jgi:glycosyltransferase involved in cell wall biosynthesis